MISWIQRTFQQHFKWLFLFLLVIIIVSFVFITNASSGFGHTVKQAPDRPFFGLNLSSTEDTRTLVEDATLSVQLHGMQIRDEGQFQQYALQRHAALHLAAQLRLPAPSTADLTAYIQTLRAFAGNDGKFDANRYAQFRDNLKTNPQLTEGDIARVIADDVTYQKVLKLISGPGYVLPADVQQQLNRIDALWTIEVATIDIPSYQPNIAVTPEALTKYFELNAPRYEIGPKTGVDYIDLPTTNFIDKVTFTEEALRAFYDANTSRFIKPKSDQPSTPDADFAAVRKQVEAVYRAERAQPLANTEATNLSVALYENKITEATLDAFLASRQLTRKTVAPFNASSIPAELGTSPQIATEALKLNADRRFSDPINTGRGAAIMVWKETVPARQPSLEEVKDKVTADYINAEKYKNFSTAGAAFRNALEARIKAGDTLSKAVQACAKTIPAKVDTKAWSSFTLAQPPEDIDYTVYATLDTLKKGELSQMVTSIEQGIIIHVTDKVIPAVDTNSPKFSDTRAQLQTYTASRNGGAILAAIVEAELAKSTPATP